MDRRSRLMAPLRGETVDRPAVSFYEINGLNEDPVDPLILTAALDSSIADYEDAVLHGAAQSSGVDCIITRNVRDFRAATLPVYEPREFLAAYEAR